MRSRVPTPISPPREPRARPRPGRSSAWLLAVALLVVACGDESGNTATSPAAEPSQPAATATPREARPAVVFLGTSLTAGLGIAPEQAFPALIQERIDAADIALRVVNAGVSGDTSAGGLRRIDWLLREPVYMLVLELGANDMLRGQDVAAMRTNLQAIIDRTREKHPRVRLVIAGMQSAPNLGDAYATAFAESFASLARENGATLIPFLLEGVAAAPELNQPDGIHPTSDGHRVIADRIWPVLEPLLREAK
jgi:acyl-CoA thioesterase I